MKNKFKRIHSKKGMTYVEVLVALSILALIVVVFTPILMYSYEKLYTAGDINIKTYEVKSYIEESLAVRSNNPKVRTKFGLQGLSEQLDIVMHRITSAVDGLETMYGVPKSGVTFLGESVLTDNTSSHQITIQFTDFEDLSNDNFVQGHSPTGKQIAYAIESPLREVIELSSSQYSIVYDSSTKSANLTIKGVDVTYSPLRIIIRFVDATGRVKIIDKYIDIIPARMMFVGAADGTTDYYTTAGFDEDEQFILEARNMSGGALSGGTNFNKIMWVTTGADNTGPIGYYAMCGNGGSIRRLWIEKRNGYNKYSWSGDNTEIYTYGADFNATNKTVSDVTRNLLTDRGPIAASFTNYNGLYLNSGISIKNCIQISNNISTNSDAATFKNENSKEGMYFYTASESNYDNNYPTPRTLKKNMYVNWEDYDKVNMYEKGGSPVGGGRYNGVWVNYILNGQQGPYNGSNQPVAFFATSTAGDRNNTSTDGIYNKGGKAKVEDSSKQIDSIFLMTDNYPGRVFYSLYWYDVNADGSRGTRHGSDGGKHDVGAVFSAAPVYPAANQVKFSNGSFGSVPDIENSFFTDNQKKMLRYIINTLSDGVRVLNSETKSFIGRTDDAALDKNIPYVRLKCYTNKNTRNLTEAFSSLTAESVYKNSVLDSVIKNPNAQTIKNQTALELTDMCFIDNGEENSINYVGYSPASAYIYSTVLTSVHKDVSGNNSVEQGYIQPYVIRGTGSNGYDIAQLPATADHWRNQSSLPGGTKTGTDTNTAFTLGYSSNRALLFSSTKTLEQKHKFQYSNVEDSALQIPDEFTSYLSYAQDADVTLAVGYTTTGNVELGKFSTPDGCTDHGLTSAQIGNRPIYINSAFFYNTEYSNRAYHTENSQSYQIAFKNVNEDINLGPAFSKPYCRGYFLEAANLGQTSESPTAYVLQKTHCAATYTKLGFKEDSSEEQPITNAGVIAVHFEGDSSFRTIYTAPSTDERLFDSRFTCAAVGTTTVAEGDNVSTYYKAYIGDSKGNIWCIPQFQETDSKVNLASYTVDGTLLDSAGTGMSSITKIYLTGNRLIIIGKLATDQTKTKMIVIEQTFVDPEDPESALNPPEIKVNITHSYTLHDIAEHNGVLYAIGTTTSGSNGVILYSAEPTDSSVGWTAVTTAKNANGGTVNLKPLYSFAAVANTEMN